MFYDFLRTNGHFSIFVGALTVTSYINGWYLFWYQWKEDVHTYTLVVNLGLYDLQYW